MFEYQLGLDDRMTLVEHSDSYDYYTTNQKYVQSGQPSYIVFKNVDYNNDTNLDTMELISAEFAALNNTVIPPVYSWVGIFKNFI